MEITEKSYKLFRLGNQEDSTIFLEQLSPQEDYYATIARHAKTGKKQIIMSVDILMNFVKDISCKFKPYSVKFSSDVLMADKVVKVLENIPTALQDPDVLEVMINGLSINSVDLTSITFDNETDSFTIIVNGIVNFENEPSEDLKELIVELVQNQFK